MKFPIEYGHRQLNIFYVPLVEIFEDGFNYKGKKYLWSDVKDIIIRDPKLGVLWGYPSGRNSGDTILNYIELNGGKGNRFIFCKG